jgi:hypothetical protein
MAGKQSIWRMDDWGEEGRERPTAPHLLWHEDRPAGQYKEAKG